MTVYESIHHTYCKKNTAQKNGSQISGLFVSIIRDRKNSKGDQYTCKFKYIVPCQKTLNSHYGTELFLQKYAIPNTKPAATAIIASNTYPYTLKRRV